jgi:hypothetical protein
MFFHTDLRFFLKKILEKIKILLDIFQNRNYNLYMKKRNVFLTGRKQQIQHGDTNAQ